ncbi:MAG: CHASE2 domain-containing protein [Coriobacteriales bacterium]
MDQIAKRLLLPLVAALVAFALALAQPFYAADAMLGDALKQRPAAPSPQIMVIGIDESTLGEYGAFTTWSRQKTAELLEFLYADPAQAPAVVAIDVIFQGQTDPSTDERLARAAAKGNTVVAGNLVYSGTTKLTEDGQRVFDPWNIQGMETAYPALLASSSTGFADACISGDGVVRSALLFAQVNGQQEPSFATQAYTQYLRATGQLAAGQQPPLPATADGICEFFYAAKSGEYQTVALNTVLSGAVPASEFAGKIVLLGAYASGMQDSYLTANGHSSTYGVGVHCGPAVVGNIGCDFRKDYTAIGDTVNTAARLEANAPRGQIYISRELLERLEGRVQAEPVGPLALKGKANAVEVFRVTGLCPGGE